MSTATCFVCNNRMGRLCSTCMSGYYCSTHMKQHVQSQEHNRNEQIRGKPRNIIGGLDFSQP